MTAQTDLTIDERILERGGWLVRQVDVNYGLRKLEVSATWGEDRDFRLSFKDFHLLSWQILDDEYDPEIDILDVIGFDLGEREGRKSAVLNARVCEIILTYSEMEILKDW